MVSLFSSFLFGGKLLDSRLNSLGDHESQLAQSVCTMLPNIICDLVLHQVEVLPQGLHAFLEIINLFLAALDSLLVIGLVLDLLQLKSYHSILNLIDVAGKIFIGLVNTILYVVAEVLQLALGSRFTFPASVRTEDKNVAIVLKYFVGSEKPGMVFDHLADLLQFILLLGSVQARVLLTHDGNQQVHENELHNDGCKEEVAPCHGRIFC